MTTSLLFSTTPEAHAAALASRFADNTLHTQFLNWRNAFVGQNEDSSLPPLRAGFPWASVAKARLTKGIFLRTVTFDDLGHLEEEPLLPSAEQQIPLHALHLNPADVATWDPPTVRQALLRYPNAVHIRISYCSTEYDIYETYLSGFSATTLWLKDLDVYRLQYLAEMAKEVGLAVLPVVTPSDDMTMILETDIPYVLLYVAPQDPNGFSHLMEGLTRIPRNMVPLALGAPLKESSLNSLVSFGLKGYLT